MAQMNPLIGPKLNNSTILMMAREWGNKIINDMADNVGQTTKEPTAT